MNLPDDMEDFVALSPRTRSLTADAGDPTPNGYRLEIVSQRVRIRTVKKTVR